MRPSSPLASFLCALAVLAAGPLGVAAAQETQHAALAASFHLDDASLPDPTRSPGDTSKDAVADDLCDSPIEDFAKTPPKALCDDLFAETGASEAYRFQYACAFVVPPSIGGSQSIANVWLQPVAEARLKTVADAAVRKHVCRNPDGLADAQRLMASNWVSAYRKYLLPGDQLAPVKPDVHVPDAFSALPPVPADVTPAASCASGAGLPSALADGDGPSGQENRRRHRLQGSRQDDRWRGEGRGAGERGGGPRQARDEGGPWPHGRDREGRGEAARRSNGRNAVGGHDEASRDAARRGEGRYADGRMGPSRDGYQDARDFEPRGGERERSNQVAPLRAKGPRQSSADAEGAGWPHRFSDPSADGRGSSSNRLIPPGDRGSLPSRYARAQDVTPNDVRPNDVRPNDVRPNDVRPNRPGLGLPRYPRRWHRTGYGGRRHR